MAKKKTSAFLSQPILLLVLLGGLAVVLWAMMNRTPNPDSLAAEVQNRIVCPREMRPTLVCPTNLRTSPVSGGMMSWWKKRRSDCNWQCTPFPSFRPSSRPVASCKPRPVCLDANPRCLLPEPVEGWCPSASTRPLPSGIRVSPFPRPSFCPVDIVCPLNCVQRVSSENLQLEGCPVCDCGSGLSQ